MFLVMIRMTVVLNNSLILYHYIIILCCMLYDVWVWYNNYPIHRKSEDYTGHPVIAADR